MFAVRQARRAVLQRSHLGFVIVPQQTAVVIERFGKFRTSLAPGFHFLVPIADKCAYRHSLKEEVYPISSQMAITKDNVTITLDGVLYMKITDPYKASYGVGNPVESVKQLAQTTMRSELGKLTFDRTFEEREILNLAIVKNINEAAHEWGVQCMRYEIRDITPPANIRKAMELQAESERQKRSDILTSEGKKQADINIAEGQRTAAILKAEGEAKAIVTKATATAEGIKLLAESIEKKGGSSAVALRIAEEYVGAFSQLAKKGTTMIIPADTNNVGSMVAQSLGIFKHLVGGEHKETAPTKTYSDPVLDSTSGDDKK